MCMYYGNLWSDFVTLTCHTEKCIIHKHFSLWYYNFVANTCPVNLITQYFFTTKDMVYCDLCIIKVVLVINLDHACDISLITR